MTMDTGTYLVVIRTDIAARWPERQPTKHFTLQTLSGESLPILMEVFLTMTLDMLAGAKYFSTVDLKRGYWQADLHPDHMKSAFSKGQELWQFTIMPFGLRSSDV
jgi:hypothetical protein